jgi:formylglycine-generating enzyme required for sulfatase activity
MDFIRIIAMKLNNLLFVLTLTLMSACNGVGTADFKEAALGTGSGEQSGESGTDSSLVFAGVSSVSAKNDTSLTLNWTAHPDAVAYDVFDTTSGSLVFKNTIVGQAQSSISLSNLTPGSTYKFRVRIRNAAGLYDANTNDLSVTMNPAPDVPSALSLVTPSTSPGYLATPTIRVSGVKSGDTVKVFSDSSCSTERGSAVSSGTTIDITSSSLAVGSYTFYATSTNASNNSSACSTANVSYTLSSCPAGYIGVPANASLGVNAFCVAQFEMKNVGSVATSQAAGAPWVSINQTSAKTACTSLGAGYDLISNPEWMTIAHEIEKTAANWSSGVVGTGMLNRGHSDNSPGSALAVTDTNDPYIGTGNNSGQAAGSGWEQKRTHTLSNGQVVWDIAGNVWEWTDWSLGGGLTSGPTSCTAAWTQLPVVSCGALAAADYMPANPASVTAANYNSNYGLGQLYGGGGGAALRGGGWSAGASAGAFTLNLGNGPGSAPANIGFRCVFRP